MKYAILFLTLLSVYNLFAYWRMDYLLKELGDIRPSKSKKKVKAINTHKPTKKRSRARI